MKTNQNGNRNRSTKNSRRPLNRNQNSRPGGIKSRIGRSGTLAGKPKTDLRQILIKKVAKSPNKPTANKPTTSSDVKSRLGLQSKTARLEALKAVKEQMRAAKDKNNPKDVKTQNSQIKNTMSKNQKPEQRNSQATRKPVNSMPVRRDQLRDIRISSRRPLDRSAFKSDYRIKNDRLERSQGIKSVTTQPIIIPQYIPASPIVYQQATHHSNYDNGSAKYVRRSPISQPEVVTTIGNSVLVSNLSPKITEDEVAELFGDIGPLMNVQIINSTTALVTYFASQHASKAVKVYNYRLLDGIAMNCTILPQTNSSVPQSVSTQPPLYSSSSGRMYSDSIPLSRSSIRPNYNLSL